MLENKYFYDTLLEEGIDFFTGVPDSLLKNICAYISDHSKIDQHIIAANEGGAIALAVGHYLATQKLALVYLQNSGLGNIINPLLSLADKEVYQIPMILMIGWRGEPGFKDEPQHLKQGRVQNALLDAMEIPYFTIDSNTKDIRNFISNIISIARLECKPIAIIVRNGTFQPYTLLNRKEAKFKLNRENALKIIINLLKGNEILVATTGMLSREVFEFRKLNKQEHKSDFLTVGSMGHANQIALGIAIKSPHKNVICLDGDGSVLMHMGSLAIIGSIKPFNYIHIIFNNGAHDSVGGQPTVGLQIDFCEIANACGYLLSISAESENEIETALQKAFENRGPSLIEIKINKGFRHDLGRPTTSPKENKIALINYLKEERL